MGTLALKPQIMEKKYYAHTKNDAYGMPLPQDKWQPLKDHLHNVAALARKFAEEARPGDAEFSDACVEL